ncbi:hypothetical protein [Actinophytocola oryzae]|uniref:Uncharacterized protein n=1 Tax=Actinophytocola oryzae TaxID=502181 RepID=A0A4R7USV9_9PSEU|nr:hypothetical protein [Actinophytocola oryzae]TDV38635.1 hypothetical protein CLV71_12620 [Actinophytocola oryzae]
MARHEQAPARRAQARRRRTWLGFAKVWTYFWGILAVSATVFVPPWSDGEPDTVGGVYACIAFAVLTALGVLTVRLRSVPKPQASPLPPIHRDESDRSPSPDSSAWQPMRQLAATESALSQLIGRIRTTGVAPSVVEESWRTAAERRRSSARSRQRWTPWSWRPGTRVAQWTGLDPARDYEAAAGGVLVAVIVCPW